MIIKGGEGSGITGHRTLRNSVSKLDPASRKNVLDKLKAEQEKRGGKVSQEGGEEVYHATAEGYAQSIMKDGLKKSMSGKGMISGVYASTQPGESFYYARAAAEKEFQSGLRTGKYTVADIKNIKVMMIVVDKVKFPEAGYAADKENTIFRSKKDILPDSFKRVEIYKYSDADAFSRKWQDARIAKKPLPKMPPPKPVSVVSSPPVKASTPEVFLSFGYMEGKKTEEKQLDDFVTKIIQRVREKMAGIKEEESKQQEDHDNLVKKVSEEVLILLKSKSNQEVKKTEDDLNTKILALTELVKNELRKEQPAPNITITTPPVNVDVHIEKGKIKKTINYKDINGETKEASVTEEEA